MMTRKRWSLDRNIVEVPQEIYTLSRPYFFYSNAKKSVWRSSLLLKGNGELLGRFALEHCFHFSLFQALCCLARRRNRVGKRSCTAIILDRFWWKYWRHFFQGSWQFLLCQYFLGPSLSAEFHIFMKSNSFKPISAMCCCFWLWVYNSISSFYLDRKKSHAKSLRRSIKICYYHTVKDDISTLWNISVVLDQDRC